MVWALHQLQVTAGTTQQSMLPTQHEAVVSTFFLTSSQPVTLGRPLKKAGDGQADIVIGGDSSVSKLHAVLKVSVHQAEQETDGGINTSTSVAFQDKSRFGSSINHQRLPHGTEADAEVWHALNDGDHIKLGPKAVFRMRRHPTLLLVQGCKDAEGIAEAASSIGIATTSRWCDGVTHVLQGDAAEATPGLLCALMLGLPVISPSWLQAVSQQKVWKEILPAADAHRPAGVALPAAAARLAPSQPSQVALESIQLQQQRLLAGLSFAVEPGPQSASLCRCIELLGGSIHGAAGDSGPAPGCVTVTRQDTPAGPSAQRGSLSADTLLASILLGDRTVIEAAAAAANPPAVAAAAAGGGDGDGDDDEDLTEEACEDELEDAEGYNMPAPPAPASKSAVAAAAPYLPTPDGTPAPQQRQQQHPQRRESDAGAAANGHGHSSSAAAAGQPQGSAAGRQLHPPAATAPPSTRKGKRSLAQAEEGEPGPADGADAADANATKRRRVQRQQQAAPPAAPRGGAHDLLQQQQQQQQQQHVDPDDIILSGPPAAAGRHAPDDAAFGAAPQLPATQRRSAYMDGVAAEQQRQRQLQKQQEAAAKRQKQQQVQAELGDQPAAAAGGKKGRGKAGAAAAAASASQQQQQQQAPAAAAGAATLDLLAPSQAAVLAAQLIVSSAAADSAGQQQQAAPGSAAVSAGNAASGAVANFKAFRKVGAAGSQLQPAAAAGGGPFIRLVAVGQQQEVHAAEAFVKAEEKRRQHMKRADELFNAKIQPVKAAAAAGGGRARR